jgi:hypothetical protein
LVLFAKQAVDIGERPAVQMEAAMLATARQGQAVALGLASRWDEAEEQLYRAVHVWEGGGPVGERAIAAWLDYAELLHGQGKHAKARSALEHVAEMARGSRLMDIVAVARLRESIQQVRDGPTIIMSERHLAAQLGVGIES